MYTSIIVLIYNLFKFEININFTKSNNVKYYNMIMFALRNDNNTKTELSTNIILLFTEKIR